MSISGSVGKITVEARNPFELGEMLTVVRSITAPLDSLLDGQVTIHVGQTPLVPGKTYRSWAFAHYPGWRDITINPDSTNQVEFFYCIPHEIGHFVDSDDLISADRRTLMGLMMPNDDVGWSKGSYWNRKSETFAHTFAVVYSPVPIPKAVRTKYKYVVPATNFDAFKSVVGTPSGGGDPDDPPPPDGDPDEPPGSGDTSNEQEMVAIGAAASGISIAVIAVIAAIAVVVVVVVAKKQGKGMPGIAGLIASQRQPKPNPEPA